MTTTEPTTETNEASETVTETPEAEENSTKPVEAVENKANTVSAPDAVLVKCSKCETEYDVIANERVCPNCGTVRRGRMPKQAANSSSETNSGEAPKVKKEKTKDTTKKYKFTEEDMYRPLTPMEMQLAGIPVAAVHMMLTKKRGYGLTKNEAEKGNLAFGMLTRKYAGVLTEYLPEIMCAGFVLQVVVTPEVTAEEYARMAKEAAKNAPNNA